MDDTDGTTSNIICPPPAEGMWRATTAEYHPEATAGRSPGVSRNSDTACDWGMVIGNAASAMTITTAEVGKTAAQLLGERVYSSRSY